MQVVLLSGVSGSGKSVALNVLEDSGYYCLDNLPVNLLPETVDLLRAAGHVRVAVSIDARSGGRIDQLPDYLESFLAHGIDTRVVFLDAKNDTLLRRFAETRRRHPLATDNNTLEESITRERDLLAPVAEIAHRIDTSSLHPNMLRTWIKQLLDVGPGNTTVLFESFGYKHGVPLDADFVFDVRCLPNPFYDPRLRALSGLDEPVRCFLEKEPLVGKMLADIQHFIQGWLPVFRNDSRAYLTIALGCTGGQHRSVYLAERLAEHFRSADVTVSGSAGMGTVAGQAIVRGASAPFPVIVRHRQLAH